MVTAESRLAAPGIWLISGWFAISSSPVRDSGVDQGIDEIHYHQSERDSDDDYQSDALNHKVVAPADGISQMPTETRVAEHYLDQNLS